MMNQHVLEILRSENLNLLLVLDALLQERSATKAAKRLGITQSRVSHALRELRAVFDDDLLVRSGNAMVPTRAALSLEGPLRRGLGELARVFSSEPAFDPGRSSRTFRIAAADYTCSIFAPRLLRKLTAIAPGIRIVFRPFEFPLIADQLRKGEIDVAVGVDVETEEPLERAVMFPEEFKCIVRKDHPVVGLRITREQYSSLPHLLVSPSGYGEGAADVGLRQCGMTRRIVCRIPSFLLAPQLVATTDVIVTLPGRMVSALKDDRLRVLSPPIDLPGFDIVLLWHKHAAASPAIQWLCSKLTWALCGTHRKCPSSAAA